MSYPQLYIKKSREKALANRHSWIFSGAVATASKMNEGDIIEIRKSNGQLAAYAFYVAGQSIVAKIFEYTDKPLNLSPQYWQEKVFKAFRIRQQYLKGITTAYRLIFAEGDFFPGLIIDVYNNVGVIQTYHIGIDRIFDHIVEALKKIGIEHVFLKKKPERSVLNLGWQTQPYQGQLIIEEYGLKFAVDIEQGQKTGFYVDQRENRRLVERYAKDKKVLNLFSYTGAFSLYAMRAGAQKVVSVDISNRAIELAKHNILLNGFDSFPHQEYTANCFDYLDNISFGQYDLIIVDPPAFAKSQQAVKNAVKGYKDLNYKVLKKVAPGGLIFTFSCSQRVEPELFRKVVFSAAAEAGRQVRILHQLSQGIDHPINIFHPETEYLKGFVLYVE